MSQRASPLLTGVIIGKEILSPLEIAMLAVNVEIRMGRDSIPFLSTVPNDLATPGPDVVRHAPLQENLARLKDHHHARPQVSTAMLPVPRTDSEDEKKAAVERKFPEWIRRVDVCGSRGG